MPLASWFTLHWYGPGAMAAVMQANSALVAQLEAEIRAGAALTAPTTLTATLQPGRYMEAALTAPAALTATMEPQIRMRSTMDVAARPSAEDVAQAVVNTLIVENGLSVGDIMRVLLAVAAGKTTITPGSPTIVTFRDQADARDRVRAAMDGSERDAVTIDGGAS